MDDDYLEIHAKEMAYAEVKREVQKFLQKINDAKPTVRRRVYAGRMRRT